jgi:hypothetical protein
MNTVSALANMNQDTTEITETATKIRRHGRSVERSSLTFPSPDSEWSLKDAHSLNPDVCHATIYHYVKDQVRLGLMIQTGTRKNKRGKASLLYRIATPADMPAEAPAESNQPF